MSDLTLPSHIAPFLPRFRDRIEPFRLVVVVHIRHTLDGEAPFGGYTGEHMTKRHYAAQTTRSCQ